MFKKSVVIKADKLKFNKKIKFDYKILFFCTLLICGIILGIYTSKNMSGEFSDLLSTHIENQLKVLQNDSFFNIFLFIFIPMVLVYLIIFALGISGVGIPFICIVLLFLGWLYGFKTHQYHEIWGLQGALCMAMIFLPVNSIAAATYIRRCCHCFDISGEIFLYLITGKGESKPVLKDYVLKHLFFIVPIILASLVSALLFIVLSKILFV